MEDIGNIKETQTQKMLRQALEKAQAEYRLSFRFHDLQKIKRNGDYYLVSSDVNKAENYKKIYLWTYKSCGCCQDAVIYALPYIIVDDINIYAKADGCAIGEGGSSFYGIMPYESRFKKYEEYGFSRAVITKIEQFLAINSPVPYDDDEDEDEDDV